MNEIREKLGELNIRVLGKTDAGLELTVLPILSRAVMSIFPEGERDKLFLDLKIRKNLSFESDPTDVQIDFPKEDGEPFTFLLKVQEYKNNETNKMLLDLYTLLCMNLIMAKYNLDGRLKYEGDRELFDGEDITDKDMGELTHVLEALEKVDGLLDEYLEWAAKSLRHLN